MKTVLTSIKFWLTLFAAAIFGVGVVGRVVAAAAITVNVPTAGQLVEGSSVPVTIEATGIKLTDYKTTSRNGYNQGHLHLWLDQDNPTKSSAIKTIDTSYTFENVKYGDHTLLVEIVNNDHSSLNPKVVTSVDFKTVAPMAEKSYSLLFISIAAFLFLCVTLYFVSLKTKSHSLPSSKKSSRKLSKKRS